jgi:aspartate racemase
LAIPFYGKDQMKTIGMIGGMSWESTLEYYRLLNEGVRERLGGLHSARCLLYSVDFAEIETLQQQGRWEEANAMMVEAVQRLERGGGQISC